MVDSVQGMIVIKSLRDRGLPMNRWLEGPLPLLTLCNSFYVDCGISSVPHCVPGQTALLPFTAMDVPIPCL